MNFENMLNKRNQAQRPHMVWFHLHEISKSIEIENGLVVAKMGWGGGKGKQVLSGYGFLWKMTKICQN